MAQSNIASTQDKLLFVWSHNTEPGANRDQYVDIAQCLSIVNRRFYRQGMNYAVGSIEFFARSGEESKLVFVPAPGLRTIPPQKLLKIGKTREPKF